MSIRKSDDRANETDSRYNRTKDTFKAAEITERFDLTTDNDNKFDSAIQYINEKVDECIDALNTNTSKTGITTSQASAITANTAKTGISTSQASAITANTAKTGITSTQASRITANTAKTGITSTQASQITANNAKIGTETDLSVTEGMTLKATVAVSRGVYTLTFTVTHDRVTKTANITMS